MYKADPNDNTKQIPKSPDYTTINNEVTVPALETLVDAPNYVICNTPGTYAFLYQDYVNQYSSINGFLTSSNSSPAVTGSGTAFTEELSVGDNLKITSASVTLAFTVKSIESDTLLTLNSNWTGNTITGSTATSNNVKGNQQYKTGSVVNTNGGPITLPIQPVAWRQTDAAGSVGDVSFVYVRVR
jgi:hypothetical protein